MDSSQVRRQKEAADLEEIDEIMDGIMGDQASEMDQLDEESSSKSVKT